MSGCPTCGRPAPDSGCSRCQRPPKAGATARLTAVAGPPGARPGARVGPSGWRPAHELTLDDDAGELRIDAGVARPVPCPGCGKALAARGATCKGCARVARGKPPVTPSLVGSTSRLTRPVGPPGSEKGTGVGVKPSDWKPKPLHVDEARFEVIRDAVHIFTLRAPLARPYPT